MPHLESWPLELGDPKEKFHVKPSFKFTSMKLTGQEKRLLQRCGKRFQAFEDGMSKSSSDEYKHFMKVLQEFKEGSWISSNDRYRQFIKVCENSAEPITKKERVWLKYQTMLEEEKRLKQQHEEELIRSPERDEYIKSRLVP